VLVDGAPVKTPYTWTIGDSHTAAALSPVPCGNGCQYVFTPCSNGAAQSHTITVPGSPTTYKVSFPKQFLLTVNVNPQAGGTVKVSEGWCNAGQKITLTATASTGYTFKSWTGKGSGSYNGNNASPTITMNSAITETANFA